MSFGSEIAGGVADRIGCMLIVSTAMFFAAGIITGWLIWG